MSNLFFQMIPTMTYIGHKAESGIRHRLGSRFDQSRLDEVAYANSVVITLCQAPLAETVTSDFITRTIEALTRLYTPAKWKRTWVTSIIIMADTNDPNNAIVHFSSTQRPNA